MREKEVRTQVSGARSAQNDPGLMSSAVKQTPLTATLLPVPSSFGVFSAVTVIRRFSPRCSILVTCPTSSTMPVNMSISSQTLHHSLRRDNRTDFAHPDEPTNPCHPERAALRAENLCNLPGVHRSSAAKDAAQDDK